MRNRPLWLALAICALLIAHLVFLGARAHHASTAERLPPLSLDTPALSPQVVLVILDSWALRVMDDAEAMPRLFARKAKAASGELWAPRITGTMQGMRALSTGSLPDGVSTLSLFGSPAYPGWTFFDDLVAQHRRVLFHGGPGWVDLFGARAPGSFRYTGSGPLYRQDDLEAIAHFEAAQQGAQRSAFSLIHLSETDHAAHQHGTRSAAYSEVLRFWDDTLDALLTRTLQPGTTVILTSDHGNDVYGTHGGDGDLYRRVPVLMWGEGIRPGAGLVMHAHDMPATLAVLLGTRAPGEAAAMPATAALALSPHAEMRVLLQAYRNIVAVAERAGDEHQLAFQQSLARLERDAAAVDSADAAAAGRVVADLRRTSAQILPTLEPQRRLSLADLAFTVATLAAALALLRWAQLRLLGKGGWPLHTLVLAMAAIEAAAALRFAKADSLKAAFATGAPGRGLLVAGLVLAVSALALWAWRQRAALARRAQQDPFSPTLLAYLLATALLPFSVVALIGLVLLTAYALGRPWPVAAKLGLGAALALYYLVALHVGWRLVSEDPAWRYGLGVGSIVAMGLAIAALERRFDPGRDGRASGAAGWPRGIGLAALALALLLFPYSTLRLQGLPDAMQALASIGGLALFTWACSHRGAARLAWIGPASTLLYWQTGQDWALFLMFGLHVALLVSHRVDESDSPRGAASVFLLLGSMLLAMSSHAHAASVAAFLVLLLAFQGWQPPPRHAALAVALAALLLVNLRHALFDLFGYVDSPISGYVLKHLDLGSAYLGSSPSGLARGATLVLLKVWLAGAVLAVALAQAGVWRRWAAPLAAAAGACLLFNVAQMGLRADLSTGTLTSRFDLYTFSLFVHSTLFLLGASAWGAWVLLERRHPNPQIHHAATWLDN